MVDHSIESAMHLYEKAGPGNQTFDLTILATSDQGFDNLRKLSSMAYLEGFSYRPRTDLEAIAAHSEGLLALGPLQSVEGHRVLIVRGEGGV